MRLGECVGTLTLRMGVISFFSHFHMTVDSGDDYLYMLIERKCPVILKQLNYCSGMLLNSCSGVLELLGATVL